MNSGFLLLGRVHCERCAESQAQGFGGQMPIEAFQPLVDPTICVHCGRDNGSRELRAREDAPLCQECRRITEPVPEDLQRVLGDVEQYMSLGFLEDAKEALGELRGRYSDHPAFVKKLAELSRPYRRSGVVKASGATHGSDPPPNEVTTQEGPNGLLAWSSVRSASTTRPGSQEVTTPTTCPRA
jgi:hypothetical protein